MAYFSNIEFKKRTLPKVLFLITFLLVNSCEKRIWYDFEVDIDKLTPRVDSLVMFKDGNAVGSWVLTLEKKGENVIFIDKSVLTGVVEEVAETTLSTQNLKNHTYNMNMTYAGGSIHSKFTWSEGNINGTYSYGSKKKDLKEVFSNIIPRHVLIPLLPAIKIETITPGLLKLYSSEANSVWDVKITARPAELEMNSKKYQTNRIELIKAGKNGVSNIFYISKEKPFRILKVEIPEQNMTINYVGNDN